ncbi:DUF6356 family protein [Sphingosinicella sp. CPCC 101087]|uniref:DUF6356 family protein n=1 Tax=Sphingosinicella sp. CPCC 101087 TaxID=2497754 RepID=UPI00101CAC2C|nr:DUF6356 family protein [Sphingosinicella sp. CPCC 101087]
MRNPFSDHPAAVGESYAEHLLAAARFGIRLIGAGLACLVHGLLPFLFERTGSNAVTALSSEMNARRPGASKREIGGRAHGARS